MLTHKDRSALVCLKASSLLHRRVATTAQAGHGLPQLIMSETHLLLTSEGHVSFQLGTRGKEKDIRGLLS